MFNLGWSELLIILLIVLFLFGAKNIPEIAKGLGKAITSFKKGLKETEDDLKASAKDDSNKDSAKKS